MTIEEMKAEILTDLTTELMVDDADLFNLPLLTSKVNNAVMEVKTARKYPKSYTEEMIVSDLTTFYSNIRNLALYDYNQSGAEGQTSYSGDGNNIHYVDREKYFYGVLPISGVV